MPWEPKHAADDLFAAARRLADEGGGTLTLFAFCDAFGISPSTIHARFGGWLKFRQRAGLTAERSFTVPPLDERQQRMVAQLQTAAKELGPELSLMEFCQHSRVSNYCVQALFGGWRKLRTEAGLFPRTPSGKLTPLHLLAEIHRLEKLLGFFPLPRDIERHSRYGTKVYRKHFENYEALKRDYAEETKPLFRPPIPREEDRKTREDREAASMVDEGREATVTESARDVTASRR
ncbi:MAG: hypothetical protein SH850_20135 [Planctomycetaceae bacterium]|nr:hypothetical protein [Planctomycetaceae bacterium]